MKKPACIVLLLTTLLIGCTGAATKDARDADTEARRIAHDRVLCQSYGFGKSAEDLGHCMQVLKEQRAETARDH